MYYKQLDSLRALAVIMVIVFHWIIKESGNKLPLGSWGVELFFVLSGFLITKILLESRLNAELQNLNKLGVFKNFVIRRSLRIFPLYYLVLILILVFDRTNISGLKDNIGWFFGYASNFFFFKTQHFNYPMAHFWSLAVEEQFYLVWPWFILFLPWRFLKRFFLLSAILGIASRLIFGWVFSYNEVDILVLTPTCFDLFSTGGLFAYYVLTNKNIEGVISVINKLGIMSFFIVLVILLTGNNTFPVLYRTLDSMFFLMLISNAYNGMKGVPGYIANSRILQYIGRISYGLYIYHLLTPWLTKIFFAVISKLESASIDMFIAAYYKNSYFLGNIISIIVLLSVASLSWYLFEKPFIRLKRLFAEKKLVLIPGVKTSTDITSKYSVAQQ